MLEKVWAHALHCMRWPLRSCMWLLISYPYLLYVGNFTAIFEDIKYCLVSHRDLFLDHLLIKTEHCSLKSLRDSASQPKRARCPVSCKTQCTRDITRTNNFEATPIDPGWFGPACRCILSGDHRLKDARSRSLLFDEIRSPNGDIIHVMIYESVGGMHSHMNKFD